MRSLPMLMLIGALSACALFEADEKDLEARMSGANLYLTNHTDSRVYYFVVGRETAAHINWAPHLNLDTSVAKNATKRIEYENIFRVQHEKEIIVHWWHAVWREAQSQPGEFHTIILSL